MPQRPKGAAHQIGAHQAAVPKFAILSDARGMTINNNSTRRADPLFNVFLICYAFQVVGSSILIIYDSQHVGAWVIDFAKTLPLPDNVKVTHSNPWQQGNHEEGWLTGINNLIQV